MTHTLASRRSGLLAVIFLSMVLHASGQWVPIVAKQAHLSYKLNPDGTQTLVRELRGEYFRSSKGSVVKTERPVLNGVVAGPELKQLIDAESGHVYKINSQEKRATLIGEIQLPLVPTQRNNLVDPDFDKREQKIVNGVLCKTYPIKVDGTLVPGNAWTSVDYDLQVKHEFKSGQNLTIIEVYDIQPTEPDPLLFRIPQDFVVLTGPTRNLGKPTKP